MTKERVRQEFLKVLAQQPNISATKIISNWFFKPSPMFEPAPRMRWKPEILIVGIYIALMVAVCAAFNRN